MAGVERTTKLNKSVDFVGTFPKGLGRFFAVFLLRRGRPCLMQMLGWSQGDVILC
jgi:hypothetical protein